MTEPLAQPNESTRRLRAIVRVFMSPAIWLLALYQGLMLSVLRLDLQPQGGDATSLLGPLVFATLFLGFFFLVAGTYHSFVRESSLISIGMVFRNARPIFSRFIFLSIKVGLLGFLLINIVVVVVQGVAGLEPEEIFKAVANYLAPAVGLTALALVYWLPLVFFKGNFNMFETMREALLLGWARLDKVGFLAALILLPPILLWLTSGKLPQVMVVAGSVVGEVLAWVAYVYCVDFLKTDYVSAPKSES